MLRVGASVYHGHISSFFYIWTWNIHVPVYEKLNKTRLSVIWMYVGVTIWGRRLRKKDLTTFAIHVVPDQPAHPRSLISLRCSPFSCWSSLIIICINNCILIPACGCAGGSGAAICAHVVRSFFAARAHLHVYFTKVSKSASTQSA